MEMDDGRIQKGDGNGEPGRPHEVVLETAPAPQDAVCEVRSVFCERPKRARLRDRKPALKSLVCGTKPARAWLKGRLNKPPNCSMYQLVVVLSILFPARFVLENQ